MAETRRTAARPGRLAAGMAVFALALAALPFVGQGLPVTLYEGDALHLVDIVLRMALFGELPHRDFMTPLGILGFAPIAGFARLGLDFAHAFLAAQALVATLLFGPLLRVACSRFPGGLAWLYGVCVLVLCLGLVHGETVPGLALSMHYNRWAWALAYLALPLALMAPIGRRRPVLDGALIGGAMAMLALLKITYFVAFAPAVLIGLMARREAAGVFAALLAGLAVAALATVLLGVDFWAGYLRDLISVAGSETRAAPGDSLSMVMTGPKYLGGSLLALFAVIFLRQAGERAAGLALLLLVPGFLYVTYQNFGNDPQWLPLLGLVALALLPGETLTNGLGWRLRPAVLSLGVAALALGAGSMLNLLFSPLRAALMPREGLVPMLTARSEAAGLLVGAAHAYGVQRRISGAEPGSPAAALADRVPEKDRPTPVVLNGETLPTCTLELGGQGWFETTAADLQAAGYGGSAVLVADLLSGLWLFGDFRPVEGGAPWYYAGAPGIAAADYLMVPLCPSQAKYSATMLKAVTDAGWRLIEERRTDGYILLRPERG
ncbi:hypothetical protein EOW65_18730 [Sinirhodobacter ferrireducens]|uniref:DUF2029 domain-containing protein n=1 Tax=Paenirhodobacter ferrireducens TaxID=1215032 RepID=A0A443L603_9RHOB|nr:hypothetical protein [Sinirhodobacter ferrireducens]RWR44458.1 hypothetical protein EOW65_18730 [Sinirhodobacter ferrireducens]